MKAGKLTESVLKRSVFKQLHRGYGIQEPSVGNDFSTVAANAGERMVIDTQTRCLGNSAVGGLSVYAALNNLYCSGAEAAGVLLNLLLPTSATENELREVMGQVREVCAGEQVPVLGGHTEVTRSVTEPVLTVTAVGIVKEDILQRMGKVLPGMDLVVTKWVALEGTAILAAEREEALLGRFSQPFLDRARDFSRYLSIRSEAAVAAKSGAAAMHDISEGGIYGALWEMGQSSGVGLEIDLKKIPIQQESIEICEFFDINPYKLVSGGSLLLAAADGSALVRELQKADVPAVVIGKATEGNDRVVCNGEERRFLETTQTDELWKLDLNVSSFL